MKRDRAVDTLRFLLILLVFTTHLLSLYSRAYLAPWQDGGLLDGLTGNFAVCFFALLLGYYACGAPERPLAGRLAKRYLQFALGMLPPMLAAFGASYALTRWAGVAEKGLLAYSEDYSLLSGTLQCLQDALFMQSTVLPTYWCMSAYFLGSVAVMTLSALLTGRSARVRALWLLGCMALCVLTGSWLLCICFGGALVRALEEPLRKAFRHGWVRALAVAAAVLMVRVPDYTPRCYLQGLASALLLLSLLCAPRVRRAMSWAPVARAGECSFYFYLWHAPVQSVFFALCWGPLYALAGEPGRWWITLVAWVCTLAVSLGLSALQWRAHRWLMARAFGGLTDSAAREAAALHPDA